jgi:hypothetical protein
VRSSKCCKLRAQLTRPLGLSDKAFQGRVGIQ